MTPLSSHPQAMARADQPGRGSRGWTGRPSAVVHAFLRHIARPVAVAAAAIAGLLVASLPSLAFPLPDDRTIDGMITLKWSGENVVTFRNGRKDVTRLSNTKVVPFRLFRVKNELIFSEPDFKDGKMYSQGQQRTKSAVKVGRGGYLCKRIYNDSIAGEFCYKYDIEKNSIILTDMFGGQVSNGDVQGNITKAYRINISGDSCTIQFVNGSTEWAHRRESRFLAANPNVVSRTEFTRATLDSGSCLLLKGRKAF